MFDKEILLKIFIENFVRKERRERSLIELTHPQKRHSFTSRLNHQWEHVLNMKFVEQIPPQLENEQGIQQLLQVKNDEECYVLSHYEEFDDKLIGFQSVISGIYGRGLATLILKKTGDQFYLETEQERRPAKRFIGKRMK